jgi:hypothetical protein
VRSWHPQAIGGHFHVDQNDSPRLLAGAATLPALATPAIGQAAEPDPIFAVVARAREAEKWHASLGENDDSVPALRAVEKARTLLARTVPRTAAGLAEVTGFLREVDLELCGAAPYFEDAEDSAAFNISLDKAVRGIAGLQPWTPDDMAGTAGEPDPIFAAIEAHRSAEAAAAAAFKHADHEPDTPHADQAAREAAADEATDVADQLAVELLEVEPVTMAGVIALLEYAADYVDDGNSWPPLEEGTFESTLCAQAARALGILARGATS